MMSREHFKSPMLARRSFVRMGSLLPFGISVGALGSALQGAPFAKKPSKSCILLWLDGGPSHLEMWDPKIDVPSEVRGPFGSIPTALPGVHFSEGLVRSAQIADRMTIIRSLTSPLGEHGLANHYLHTGYQPSPSLVYPSLGSIAAKRLGDASGPLPSYIAIPEIRTGMGAGYLGASAEPYLVQSDREQSTLSARDLDFYPGVDAPRLTRRREMLSQLEQRHRTSQVAGVLTDSSFESAFAMVANAQARDALDLTREPEEVRARYGTRTFGQGCLLARRLVEHNVPFVTVVQSGWDTHENLTLQLRDGFSGAKVGVGLIPTFDQAASALIEDLEHRGLLEDTLVVAMGEFGRTPKLNPRGGRDHWPRVFSAMLCGGGMPRGLVLGASDRVGESPKERPVTPADLVRTLCRRLGIDPEATLATGDGRPIAINAHGKDIHELL